jgi:Tol biopolymer transport system component
VLEQVFGAAVPAPVALSASAAGSIVYRTGSIGGGQRHLTWFDRSGKEIGNVGEADVNSQAPSLSPDGRHVALQRAVGGNSDIWLFENGRDVPHRFTFDAGIDAQPLWSPDGSRIVFASNRKGVFDLYQKLTTGTGSEELLLATPQSKNVSDWSADGRFLLFRSIDPKTGPDIWALPLDGNAKQMGNPFPVVQTNFDEKDGQFSPDGKWIAYQSNETGRFEIYVQPFPSHGGKRQMTTNGGAQVRWRRDGKELFYIALDGRLMAVPIQSASNGQTVEAGVPVSLFPTRVAGGAVQGIFRQQYDVSPNGQRFLINTVTEEAAPPITLMLNWKPKP